MAVELKPFVQEIIRIAAPSTDIGGAVIPALSGTVTAGNDTIQSLHLKTMEFAQAYKNPATDMDRLKTIAQAVEGSLMTAVTLGVLDGAKGSQLIDKLQALLEQRAD